MAESRHRPDRLRLVASALLAPIAAGWLASGSCTIAGCYEECDPCIQQCKCSNSCHNPLSGGQGLAIVASSSRILESDAARFVRVVDVALGPALAVADASEREPAVDGERLAAFARRVLDANASMFTSCADPVWRLEALERFPSAAVAHFTLEPARFGRAASTSIALLFDAHGRLLEATHVVDRTLD